jgi:hypothetical protein
VVQIKEDPMTSETIERSVRFFVDIEGTEHPWAAETITVPQIRQLGGFDAGQQVVEVNLQDNTERTLGEAEAVTLKPGHGFGKKVKFKRG